MSPCENQKTFPRGEFCRNCPPGKAGNVSKILNALINDGAVNRLAWEIWKKRGGGISSQTESEADYNKALRRTVIRICKTLG
jgi:hypothetical protein